MLVAVRAFGPARLLHLADPGHHHVLSFANPDWFYRYDSQPKLAVETRRRLFGQAAAERLRVFGTHLPFPGLGHVRAAAPARGRILVFGHRWPFGSVIGGHVRSGGL